MGAWLLHRKAYSLDHLHKCVSKNDNYKISYLEYLYQAGVSLCETSLFPNRNTII